MKHLVEIDEDALSAARASLGTMTIKDTVNIALRTAAEREDQAHARRVDEALQFLASYDFPNHLREAAWTRSS